MGKLVCFGEIMGRFSPPGYLKTIQTNSFQLSFAGGEANVAVSVANYGGDVKFVTKLPDNDLSRRCIRILRGYRVNTDDVIFGGDRMGIYFVEKGASQRPSKIIYDRKYSAISQADPSEFDWDKIFEGAEWFHFTGITPALSENMVCACRDAVKAAKKKGITISCDLNYRKNLWSSKRAGEVMSELMPYVDVCIANEEDAEKVFGIKASNTDVTSGTLNEEGYREVADQLIQRFGVKKVAITLRGSISASDNMWSGILYDGKQFYHSREYKIHLVDRVGGGDSFASGLVYGLMTTGDAETAVNYGAAHGALAMTTPGDTTMASKKEVEAIMGGAGARVNR